MEFCERDYTQMRIIPSDRDSSLSPSVSLSRTWSERRRRKGVDSTLSLPRRYASPLVCGIDVAYTRIMVDKGEQWIENCFIFRFLIRQGVSFFLGIEIVSTDNVPQLLYETSKSSLFYLRVGNVPLFPKLICNRISISNYSSFLRIIIIEYSKS